ncbi:MAG: hypothetical protein WBW04_22370 [Nitrolancea sp.]
MMSTIRNFFLILLALFVIGAIFALLASMADIKRYLRVRQM